MKKLVHEESEIVAVAASIIAQVAITVLSLDGLSQVHWNARGSFILSLVSAIMDVYAASTEYRLLCRCVSAEDIKGWIKGPSNNNPKGNTGMPALPSVASVVTVSAPFALLVVALNSFLVGFGIWLGFVWTKNLDPDSTRGDNRAVFITYAVGLGTCYLVYTASNLSAGPWKSLSKWRDDIINKMREPATGEYSRHIEERPQESQVHDPIIATASQPTSSHEELSNALRQTAKLRRELTESEELLADLYERLRRE
ncbi:hypothetical protein F4782DRAFT_531337 [Xylaria castorea]|nr:hypothetical protein F4782DRAFT_531337 [Xylaria castorea]